MNFLKDLFSQEELKQYEETVYPFNLSIIRKALDEKIKNDPDYEVFVPLIYYKQESKLKKEGASAVLMPFKWFISNRGRVVSMRRGEEGKFLKHTPNPTGYLQIINNENKVFDSITLHRALGCNFIPVPKELGSKHPKDLEVNHLDGVKSNIDLGNLEWATVSINITHAYNTGLMASGKEHAETKPVKGTVVRGRYIGYAFIMFGGRDLEKHGFDQAAVSNAANGKLDSHRNCSWSFATEEEIQTLPKGLPEEIVLDLKATNPTAKFVIVGTHMTTGEKVEFIGDKALREAGFNPSGVRNCLSGISKSAKGYTWEKVIKE